MTNPNLESFAAELQHTFLSEAEELLSDIESAIIAFEADPQDLAKISKMFRCVHTIKGSASIAGFPQLARFAHSAEALLSEIRDGKVKIDGDVADILLASNDALLAYINGLRSDPDIVIDTAEVEANIQKALGAKPAASDVHPSPIQPSPPVKAKTPTLVPKSQPSLATVLVCEDDQSIQGLIKDFLEEENYEVLCADDGAQGLKILENTPVDFIFTDYLMPEMDGVAFVRNVRKFNRTIPIIVVSGFSAREQLKDFIDLGVLEFVEKPFHQDQISRVAIRAIHINSLRHSIRGMSRLCFKAHLSLQKMEVFLKKHIEDQDYLREKMQLEQWMEEMKTLTHELLESEKVLQAAG